MQPRQPLHAVPVLPACCIAFRYCISGKLAESSPTLKCCRNFLTISTKPVDFGTDFLYLVNFDVFDSCGGSFATGFRLPSSSSSDEIPQTIDRQAIPFGIGHGRSRHAMGICVCLPIITGMSISLNGLSASLWRVVRMNIIVIGVHLHAGLCRRRYRSWTNDKGWLYPCIDVKDAYFDLKCGFVLSERRIASFLPVQNARAWVNVISAIIRILRLASWRQAHPGSRTSQQ